MREEKGAEYGAGLLCGIIKEVLSSSKAFEESRVSPRCYDLDRRLNLTDVSWYLMSIAAGKLYGEESELKSDLIVALSYL